MARVRPALAVLLVVHEAGAVERSLPHAGLLAGRGQGVVEVADEPVRGGIYTTVVAEHRKKGWRGE